MTRTTFAGAISATDTEVVLTSVTGLNPGDNIKCENESMRVVTVGTALGLPCKVYRGTNGTNVVAHAAGVGVAFGGPTEAFGRNTDVGGRQREVVSVDSAGAIAPPTPGNDRLVILTGASVQAFTLGAPAASQDGDVLTIASQTGVAHTLALTPKIGGGSLGNITFSPAAGAVSFMAMGGNWIANPSPYSGTLTNIAAPLA